MAHSVIVPIFVCVVLPVLIVFIVFAAAINNDNKRAKVLIKAIEANNNINVDDLASALGKPRKSPREVLNLRLLRGCICTFIGLGFIIVSIILTVVDGWNESAGSNLCIGFVVLAVGLSYLVVYWVTRKQVADKKEGQANC